MPIYSWRELQNLVDKKQQGLDVDPNAANPMETSQPIDLSQIQLPRNEEERERTVRQNFRDYQAARASEIEEIDTGGEYGRSSYDLRTPVDVWAQDPVNMRANAQSSWKKFRNGTLKLIPYAATTFADNLAGLVVGVGNIGVQAASDGDAPILNSFIDNPFSDWMQSVRDWSEKALPNYRTQEETDDADHWWRHLNANFWGDVVLKNLGFTIGAGAAGGVMAGGFNRLRPKTMRRAYQAALAASGGDAEAVAAFQKVLQGAPMQNSKKIYDTFEGTRNAIKRMSWEQQIIGGVGGALGEARVEALNAAKEFHDDTKATAESRMERATEELRGQIVSNPDYFVEVNGQPVLNDAGLAAWKKGLADIQREYMEAISVADGEADHVANLTFALNMPLLTASNMVMFGRLFSGGYKTQSRAKVRGRLGNYRGAGSLFGAVGKGAENTLTEGLEELSQKVISEGAKDIGAHNMASFYNNKYDTEAIRDLSSSLISMLGTAGNVLTDPQSWEEFAVGAFTGALGGGPTRVNGRLSASRWTGGVIGGIQEGLEERTDSAERARALNERFNEESGITQDGEQRKSMSDLWGGLVRHTKYENDKEDSLAKGDSFTWHTENDAQLISDVMMFADAGRLNDLIDYVESFSKISSEDMPKLREMLASETDPEFANKTDDQIRDWMTKRVDDVKKTIKQYQSFHDSLDFMSLGTSDPDVINELIYTQSQLDNFEKRYTALFDEVSAALSPQLQQIASERKADGERTERAEKAAKMLDTLKEKTLFGGAVFDITSRAQDAGPESPTRFFQEIDEKVQNKTLADLQELGAFTRNPELKQDIADLQKLIRSRQDFYGKLFDPTNRKSFKTRMKEDSVKQETVVQSIQESADRKKAEAATNGLDDLNAIKRTYYSHVSSGDAEEFIGSLEKVSDTNPAAKRFLDIYREVNSFVKFLRQRGFPVDDVLMLPKIQGLLSRAESVEQLLALRDDMFEDTTGTTAFLQNNRLREEMLAYRKAREQVQPKEELAQTPPNPVPENDTPQAKVPDPAPVLKPVPEPEAVTVPVSDKPEEVEEEIESDITEMAENVGGDEMVNDYIETAPVDTSAQDNSSSYYHGSIPEIASGEAAKARDALSKHNGTDYRAADLSDFVIFEGDKPIKNKAFADTWKALKDLGAFDAINTQVRKDDDLVFAIYKSFPLYDSRDQIIVAKITSRDSKGRVAGIQPLTILHADSQRQKHYGLGALRDAIYNEYATYQDKPDVFIFGGWENPYISKVQKVMPGLIDYGQEDIEKSITDIPAYSKSNPIIFIDREGNPISASGANITKDDLIRTVGGPFVSSLPGKKGNLYYMVPSADNRYIPVRLNVEHFNERTMNLDTPLFRKIRRLISNVAANTAADPNIPGLEQNLKRAISELRQYLDVREDIKIGQFSSADEALQYFATREFSRGKKSDEPRSPGHGTPIQIWVEKGKVRHFDELVDAGVLTTNARMLRPKGSDIRFNQWDPENNRFDNKDLVNESFEDVDMSDPVPTYEDPEDSISVDNLSTESPMDARDNNTPESLPDAKDLSPETLDFLESEGEVSGDELDALGNLDQEDTNCIGL